MGAAHPAMAIGMQVSEKFRRTKSGLAHWCPGCNGMHILPPTWTFNGDLLRPTFTPSFAHGANSVTEGPRCHYILTDGVLNFCLDCSHNLKGQSVPLPDLSSAMRDGDKRNAENDK